MSSSVQERIDLEIMRSITAVLGPYWSARSIAHRLGRRVLARSDEYLLDDEVILSVKRVGIELHIEGAAGRTYLDLADAGALA